MVCAWANVQQKNQADNSTRRRFGKMAPGNLILPAADAGTSGAASWWHLCSNIDMLQVVAAILQHDANPGGPAHSAPVASPEMGVPRRQGGAWREPRTGPGPRVGGGTGHLWRVRRSDDPLSLH